MTTQDSSRPQAYPYAQPYYQPPLINPQYQPVWNPVTRQWQHFPLTAPKILTTFWVTLLFGIIGIIPAVYHSSQAQRLGKPAGIYWGVFAVTLVANIVLLAVILR